MLNDSADNKDDDDDDDEMMIITISEKFSTNPMNKMKNQD